MSIKRLDIHVLATTYYNTSCMSDRPCKRLTQMDVDETREKQFDLTEILGSCYSSYFVTIKLKKVYINLVDT